MERLKQYVASGGAIETSAQPKKRSNLRFVWIGIFSVISLSLVGYWLTSPSDDPVRGPSNPSIEGEGQTDPDQERLASSAYEIIMSATPISDTQIQFIVSTNAPLPIEIMADVTLAGQLDHETWIGEQRKVTLDEQSTSFVLDTTLNGKSLPTGEYEAEVSYYARWGAARNPRASNVPDMSATQSITLGGSGETAEHAKAQARMQRWVLGEMDLNRVWSDAELQARLGRFESYDSPNAVRSVIYYFPDADVSLFIDPTRGKILTYELGRAL
ncbi:hypothetical protein K3181_09645 [Qipengyuania sp. YG27]|uniref:Uncharacterized protein n=1 Tax=Qipengyuania mesophila TaxID=2867246 RepID=A0ABS7JVL9_9SPHN|nr:hypothetical protein [Qipengyuania mesophila]MBX7501705.1 hypothetical protein [Qipengyuania mesophila]